MKTQNSHLHIMSLIEFFSLYVPKNQLEYKMATLIDEFTCLISLNQIS